MIVDFKNVGWFDQNWRYDYFVSWMGGSASIREVKITKTKGAEVIAHRRGLFGLVGPRDPRMDLPSPTGWTLITRPTNFEFMLQPSPLGPLGSFIPPLVPAGPGFVPVPPPLVGHFQVYSVENPTPHGAFTTDHLLGRFPAVGFISVMAPNNKKEVAYIIDKYSKKDGGVSLHLHPKFQDRKNKTRDYLSI